MKGIAPRQCGRTVAWAVGLVLTAAVCLPRGAYAENEPSIIKTPPEDRTIRIAAKYLHTWQEGPVRVFTAEGNCEVAQADVMLTSDRMVIWFDEEKAKKNDSAELRVYAEGTVTLIQGKDIRKFTQFLSTLKTTKGLTIDGNVLTHDRPQITSLYRRAQETSKKAEPEFLSKKPPFEPPKGKPVPSEAVEIRADRFDTWVEGDSRVVMLSGNVNIRKGDYELSADRAVVWFSRKKGEEGQLKGKLREVYADGEVTLFRREDVVRAESLFENRVENKGVMINGQIRTYVPERNINVIFGGKEIRQIDRKRYEAKKGYVTTDDFGKPHFKFQGETVRLIESKRSRVVSATHNRFVLQGLPVFYWPFLSKDIKDDSYFIKDFRYGHSSELGNFVLTDWDLYDFGLYRNDWSDATLELDWYQKRGPAGGIDVEYRRTTFQGLIDTYYVNDQADYDRPNVPVPRRDRGRILMRHRQQLPRGFRLDAEFSYISDRNFLREFFEQEYEEGKEQETVVYLRKLFENKGFTLVEKHRILNWQTTTEQLPLGRFYVIGEPLFDGTLEYTSQTQIGQLDKRWDEALHVPRTHKSIRFDTTNELSMPFKASIFKLKPYLMGELTAWGHREELRGSNWRTAAGVGLDASTHLSRVYGYRNEFLDVNRIRHVITPELRYKNIFAVTTNRDTLIPFDELERLDTLQRLAVGVRNRFQTRRGKFGKERVVDWIDIDLDYVAYLGSAGMNTDFYDRVEADLLWRASEKITFDSKGNEINLRKGTVDVFNIGMAYDFSPKWRLYMGHRYAGADPERGVKASSVAIFDVSYVFNEKWAASLLQVYDYNTGDNQVTKLILTRQLPAWVLEIAFEIDPGEQDTVATFSLSPAGLRQAAFRF